jgi:hypothetical protein
MVSKNRYYVYTHSHPETKEVVYIGKGTAHRAWLCDQSRTAEHKQWISKLVQQGYTPADFVNIVAQGLDNRSALDIEKETTEEYRISGAKLFNLLCYGTFKNTALSPKQLTDAADLREQGISYSKIAAAVDATTMTVWRALNNKTKAYRSAANGQ